MSNMSRARTPRSVSRAMNTLIEGAYWPHSLATQTAYTRTQDDTDGESGAGHQLSLAVGPDGDVWVECGTQIRSLRFRTWAGGGQSLRVRNALLVLAEAIRRDNLEAPQRGATPPKA